jgi:hypothetical protein
MPRKSKIKVSGNPETNWNNDNIQFPRLLAELRAQGLTPEQYEFLNESMDVDRDQVDEILERAEEVWQQIKDAT